MQNSLRRPRSFLGLVLSPFPAKFEGLVYLCSNLTSKRRNQKLLAFSVSITADIFRFIESEGEFEHPVDLGTFTDLIDYCNFRCLPRHEVVQKLRVITGSSYF